MFASATKLLSLFIGAIPAADVAVVAGVAVTAVAACMPSYEAFCNLSCLTP